MDQNEAIGILSLPDCLLEQILGEQSYGKIAEYRIVRRFVSSAYSRRNYGKQLFHLKIDT